MSFAVQEFYFLAGKVFVELLILENEVVPCFNILRVKLLPQHKCFKLPQLFKIPKIAICLEMQRNSENSFSCQC